MKIQFLFLFILVVPIVAAQVVIVGEDRVDGVIDITSTSATNTSSSSGNSTFNNTNIAYLNNTQNFTGNNTFNGVFVNFYNIANVLSGQFDPTNGKWGFGGGANVLYVATFTGDVFHDGDLWISSGTMSANLFEGVYNWIVGSTSSNYLSFNGTQLDFNETKLNQTIDAREKKTYTLILGCVRVSPADSTTYYFGGDYGSGCTATSEALTYIPAPISGNLTAVAITMMNAGTLGSSETFNMSVRNSFQSVLDTPENYIVTMEAVTSVASATFRNDTIRVNVAAGDRLNMIWTSPAWGTNPTNVKFTVTYYFEWIALLIFVRRSRK